MTTMSKNKETRIENLQDKFDGLFAILGEKSYLENHPKCGSKGCQNVII